MNGPGKRERTPIFNRKVYRMRNRVLKKRYLIIPGILLLIFLILFAAPRIARHYFVKNSRELTGRRLSIEKIRINYLTGTFRIRELKMYEADEKTVFAGFRQLRVNIDYLPLFRNEIVIRGISLDDPFVQVMQDGSRFNFSDLITSDSTVTKKDSVQKAPIKYIIHNIRIAGGFVKYTDIPLQHTISLDSLDLMIPGFTWNSDSANLDVGFSFVDGGGLSSGLKVNQADSTYILDLRIDSLNLGIIEPYIKNYLRVSSLNGFLTSDLLVKGSMSSILKLSVEGINHITRLVLQDTSQRTILSFNDLTLDIDTLDLSAGRIRINRISLTDPFILFELADTTNNWITLLNTGESADSAGVTADTTGTTTGFIYNIPEVSISGGSIQITDKTLSYPFEYKIDSLKLSVSELAEQPGRISFDISAGLNGTGKLKTWGELDPHDPDNDIDLALDIGQLRMKDLDAYFKHYFGFPVKSGIMNFKTANKLREKSLDSDNQIYFRRFALSEKLKTETKYNIPLRLSIGILSDKDGIIDLKAPVKMKGDEVRVANLGRIIFRIIGNLFIKAAVAPFNLLSGLYETDPASLQTIALRFEEAQPDDKGMKSIDIISDILNKKPQLNVSFIYCINREKAADTLAYRLTVADFLRDESKQTENENRGVADSSLISFLLSKSAAITTEEKNDLLPMCRNYIGMERLSSKLDSLVVLHTGFIADYLSNERGIPFERFRIIGTTPDSIMPIVKYPSFRVYFMAEGE